MKKVLLGLILSLLLVGCAPMGPSGSLPGEGHFFDPAVQKAVEEYLEKEASELTSGDLQALGKLQAFSIDDEVGTLRDIPTYFPALAYLSIHLNDAVSAADCDLLGEMENLQVVQIFSGQLPSFDFISSLRYVDLAYKEEAYLSAGEHLLEACVLGKEFMAQQVKGNIKGYMRMVKNDLIYELVCTDRVLAGDSEDFNEYLETKVFISELTGGIPQLKEVIDVEKRIGNASGGLHVVDVDFDGNDDILVENGHYGAQYATAYSCFLSRDGKYVYYPGFSDILNPAIDGESQKILGCWRNWAASHSYAMYSLVNDEFVMTERLTEEPSSESGEEEIVWTWLIEEYAKGKVVNQHFYSEKDYSAAQIEEMIFAENSHWGLKGEKWNALSNSGRLSDFSIYGSGSLNPTIEKILAEEAKGQKDR